MEFNSAFKVLMKKRVDIFVYKKCYFLDGNHSFTSEYMFRPSRHSEL